jgi:hypothetical protein
VYCLAMERRSSSLEPHLQWARRLQFAVIPLPPKALTWEMACPERIELEKAHDNALRNHENSLKAARIGVTSEQMQNHTVDKAVAVQNAFDALTGHIKGCPICEGR